jgi:hypothetical protein
LGFVGVDEDAAGFVKDRKILLDENRYVAPRVRGEMDNFYLAMDTCGLVSHWGIADQ